VKELYDKLKIQIEEQFKKDKTKVKDKYRTISSIDANAFQKDIELYKNRF
jgi:hypothetical protein